MFSKLKQYKDLVSQAKELKAKLGEESAVVEVEGGKLRLVIDGNQGVLTIDVDPSFLAPDKKEALEQGLRELFNAAVKKSQQLMAQKMRASGMNLPGLSG